MKELQEILQDLDDYKKIIKGTKKLKESSTKDLFDTFDNMIDIVYNLKMRANHISNVTSSIHMLPEEVNNIKDTIEILINGINDSKKSIVNFANHHKIKFKDYYK